MMFFSFPKAQWNTLSTLSTSCNCAQESEVRPSRFSHQRDTTMATRGRH